MTTRGERAPVSTGNSELELQAVARLSDDGAARADAARDLFFLYFERIERTIQRRLCLRGLAYDAASEHYGRVFDFVHRRVFSPDAIAATVSGFDPQAGSLAGWLLRRVDFAVRDWLKTARLDRAAVNSVDPAQLDGPRGAGTPADVALEPAAGIDAAFDQLSPAQRACSVLRVLTVRTLTPSDLSLVEQVSGRPRDELAALLRDMADSVPADPAGMREQELLADISDWMSWQKCQQQLYGHLRNALCDESAATEHELSELEEQACNQTAESLRQQIAAFRERPAHERRRGLLAAQFQLCARELHRCRRRLAELRREYAAARPFVLVSYEQIALILNKSVASVTTHLHESRVRIERHLKQVKTDP
jgi:DNA-directed RNA polymerase specialized sigma24 family protein